MPSLVILNILFICFGVLLFSGIAIIAFKSLGLKFKNNDLDVKLNNREYKKIIKERKEKINVLTNDAASYYENICISDEILSKLDKSILFAAIKNYNLENLFSSFNVDFNEFKKQINYQENVEITHNSYLKKIIKNRINELLDGSLITESEAKILCLSIMSESKELRDLISSLKNNIYYDDINENKKTNFYNHDYPEDNTILTLTKKN